MATKYYCDHCERQVMLKNELRMNQNFVIKVGDLCEECHDRLGSLTKIVGGILGSMRYESSLDYPLCKKTTCSYFLSGPMSGLPDWNRASFDECEQALRDHHGAFYDGYGKVTIYNPAKDAPAESEEAKPHTYYMPMTLHRLTAHYYDTRNPMTDAVILLPGWEGSYGAVVEAIVAHECGIDLVLWEGLPEEES